MRSAVWVGGALLLLLLTLWWLPFEVVISRFFLDDAFYYAKIARVFVQIGRFSFDGINETNGFHPLWMLVLLPFAWLVEDAELFVRVMLSVAAIFAGVGMGLAWKLLSRFGSRVNVALGWVFLAVSYQASWILLSGMESSLSLFLLYGSLWTYYRFLTEPSARRLNALSLWLNGLILARLDLGVFVGGLALEYLVQGRGSFPERVFRAVRLSIQSSLLPLVYFAVNWFYYGHPLPVNAVVKTSNGVSENVERLVGTVGRLVASVPAWLWLAALAVGVAGVFWIYRHRGAQWEPPKMPGLLALFSAAGVHFLLIALFRGGVDPWYLLLEFTAVGWGLLWLAEGLQRHSKVLQWSFWGVVWAVGGTSLGRILYIHFTPQHNENKKVFYEVAQWIRNHLPPDARIGCFDAGIVGYFSDRAVINLDGLVNTLDYVPYFLGDSVHKYLEKHQIPYLAQFVLDDYTFSDKYSFPPELIGDTLYQRPFSFFAAGIRSGLTQARANFLIVRLNVPFKHPSESLQK